MMKNGPFPTMQSCLIVMLLLALSQTSSAEVDCDCDYHPGGCSISSPAPRGFKCKCSYKGFWTCGGVPFPCSDNENCSGGRSSYCACVLGGGDCDAYSDSSRLNSNCDVENKKTTATRKEHSQNADCDCSYSPGGCRINVPAPESFKCVCSYKGFWTCSGWAEGCNEDEYCPGGGYSYCECKRGGGDCEAYPEADSGQRCDFSRPAPRTCDCNRNSDWVKGNYVIKSVDFDTNGITKTNPRPVAIGEALEIPNASDVEQSQTFQVRKTISTSSTFVHTHGLSISLGVTFKAKVPFVGESETSLTAETSYSFAWGSTKTISNAFSHSFRCNSPPKQHVRCQAFVTSYDAQIPYTMTLEHNSIPSCICNSYGYWKGVASYESKLTAQKIGDCRSLTQSGLCTK